MMNKKRIPSFARLAMLIGALLCMGMENICKAADYQILQSEVSQGLVDGLAELQRQGALGGALNIVQDPWVSFYDGVCTMGVTLRKWKFSVPVTARICVYPVNGGRGLRIRLADINAGSSGCEFVRGLAMKVARYYLSNEDGVTIDENAVTVSSRRIAYELANCGIVVPDRIDTVLIDDGMIDIRFVASSF